MQAQIDRWVDNLVIRLPETIATQACLTEGMKIEIRIENGSIVLSPVTKKYSLDELLARVTPENLHGEVDTGYAVGKEIL